MRRKHKQTKHTTQPAKAKKGDKNRKQNIQKRKTQEF